MRNVNRREFLVSQWLQPSRASAMATTEIVRRKSLLNRIGWLLIGTGIVCMGWWLWSLESVLDLLNSL